MSAQGWMESRTGFVEAALDAWVEAQAAPARLKEAMVYSLRAGGKRLRPLLVLAAYEGVRGPSAFESGSPPELLARFCAALELVHTYSLIHDDLPAMDDDALRRGRQTNHKVFGEAMAILAGDGLLTEAFVWLSGGRSEAAFQRQSAKGGRQALALVGLLSTAAGACGMAGGQALDIERGGADTLAQIERLHRLKTGALIRAAALGGGVIATADAAQSTALGEFGESIGLAFQVADDLLDLEGDAEQLGKAVQKDAARGIQTLPTLLGVEGSRARLQSLRAESEQALSKLPYPEALATLGRRMVERTH